MTVSSLFTVYAAHFCAAVSGAKQATKRLSLATDVDHRTAATAAAEVQTIPNKSTSQRASTYTHIHFSNTTAQWRQWQQQ